MDKSRIKGILFGLCTGATLLLSAVSLDFEVERAALGANAEGQVPRVFGWNEASGGGLVGFFGNRMSLSWKDVKIPHGGRWTFEFRLVSPDDRSFFVSVDGVRRTCVEASTSKGYLVTVKTSLDLTAGTHAITLVAPDAGWAPDLDRLRLTDETDPMINGHRPLKCVYFTPADCQPYPDRAERLDRVMKHVQAFYRREMERNGYGPLTFELEETAPGKLKLYEVRGPEPQAAYGRDSYGKVRSLVFAELARQGVDAAKETLVVFQRGLKWDGAKAIEVASYCGAWTAVTGMCTCYDDPLLDATNLVSQASGGYYMRPCSIGEFNTHYIGGIAHELGHALTLPHNGETPNERATLGHALMGSGNHTYGQRLRGKKTDTILTAAEALRLSSTWAVGGGEPVMRTNDVSIVRLGTARDEKGVMRVKGAVKWGRPIKGLIFYVDPDQQKSDYDSQTTIVKPAVDGSFETALSPASRLSGVLRIWAVREHDSVKVFENRFNK